MKNTILFLLFMIFPVLLFSQNEQIKINKSQQVIKITPGSLGIKPIEQINVSSEQQKALPINNRLQENESIKMMNSKVSVNPTQGNLSNIDLTLYTGTGAVNSFSPKTVKQGGTFIDTCSVVNWGSDASGNFLIYIVLSSDTIYTAASDYKVGEISASSINGGFYRNHYINCTIPSTVPAGSYYLYMVIDPTNLVTESLETNNLWYFNNSKMIVQSTTNDVNIAFYYGTGSVNYYDPHTLTPGGSFTAYLAVQNTGTSSSGDFKVSVGISTDQIYHFTDPEVGYITVSSINGGYYRNLTINCTVPTTQAAGSYYIVIYLDDSYAITETDESDNSNYYSDLATVESDYDPPIITHTAVTSATYNTPITVYASASDISGVSSLYLLYGKSSETTWDVNNKVYFQNGQATIPGSYVTGEGIDYAIWAIDNVGNKGYWFNINDDYLNYISVPVTVPIDKIAGYNTKGGSEYTSYELFSTPYNFGSITATDLLKSSGSYKKNWRVMNLIGSTNFVDGETTTVESGKSIFLITDKSYTIKAPSTGTTARMSNYYGVGKTLSAGWNLLGNPFSFQIPVIYMYLFNETSWTYSNPDAWSYKGTQGWVKADYLYPWQGLAVYTATSLPLKFRIGWTPSVGQATGEARAMTSEYLPNQVFNKSESKLKNSGANWYAQVSVKGEKMWDQENYFGMQECALAAKDNFDKVEPPILEDGIAAYFPHLDWKESPNLYHCDIQPVNTDGASWNFVIQSQSNENINLEFKGMENIPTEFSKYLFDLDHKTSYNLNNTSNIRITGGTGKRNLLIAVGNSNYISGKSDNIKLIPDNYVLNQNYPNPFNPSTVISFTLPNRSNVNLTLLDINGRTVKTLINEERNEGFYEIAFNAADLSSGVYYYRLQATGVKSFTDMKKMLLVK